MPKLTKPLTAKAVDNLKHGQELADGARPGLRVRRDGSGRLCWSLLILPPGQAIRRRFEIGHDLSLAEAREEVSELRRAVERGEDPAATKKAARQAALAAKEGFGTLGAVVEHYYSSGPGAALRTGSEQRKTIGRVFKNVLGRVAGDVRRTELQLAADNYRSSATASAAVGALRPVMKWAARRGLVRDDNWTVFERPELHPRREEDGRDKGQADRRHLSADELKHAMAVPGRALRRGSESF